MVEPEQIAETESPKSPLGEPQQSEHEQLMVILREHGGPVLAGVVIAVAIVLGVTAYRTSQADKAARAAQALSTASGVEGFQQVVSQFEGTPSATVALLGIGAESYGLGQYEQALDAYEQFVSANPGHPMAKGAEICKIQCLEAQGKLDEALAGFRAFAGAHPEHYLAAFASIGEARCLEQLGRFEEARAIYEEVIAADSEGIWARQAETSLQLVQRQIRAQAATP
jgi:tetratricopeptide (TPR) repeat protein